MTHLNPNLVHVQFIDGADETGPLSPRAYTLTHSDVTGELFLTIGKEINFPQIKGIYTRLMRDEVLAEWELPNPTTLHVFCHVSGGLVFGTASMRYSIFRYHMPMVLEAFCYGDRILLKEYPELAKGRVVVHFIARQKRYDQDEVWGVLEDYKVRSTNE
jgi:hypothetical protein